MNRWIRTSAVLALSLAGAIAQSAPDRDPTTLPIGANPTPNGTRTLPNGSQRNAFYVSSLVEWTAGRHTVGSAFAPCDLVLAAGGTLDITDSLVQVHGDVVIEPGGLLRVRDSELTLRGTAPHDYGFHFVGGQLDTLRTAIGGNPSTGAVSNFFLDKGLWTVRDTVVSHTGGILVGAPLGRDGDALRDGGTLLADGLVAGVGADFVHLSGKGNVALHNSTMRISLRFFDTGPQPGPIPLELRGDQFVQGPVVLGDPAVHDGSNRPPVTVPIAGSPWRLEIVNTTVRNWHLQFFDTGAGTTPRTFVFLNTRDIAIGITGKDLTGSPTLTGPWPNFYPPPNELPGLPTTSPPGYHGIPPGCGVTIGSVSLISAPGSWTKVTSWDLYLSGDSALSITGPSRVGEIVLNHASQLTLQGVEGFDAGLRCVTAIATGTSRLTIRDGTVGSTANLFGNLEASGQAVVDLDRVRLRRLNLRTAPQTFGGTLTGVDSGTINLGHHVLSTTAGENVTIQTSPGGTISTADDELANLDFEGNVSGGQPDHWTTTNVTCPPSPIVSPNSPGIRSVTYQSSNPSGSLSRTLTLPERTKVEAHVWVNPLSMPTSGNVVLRIRDATGNTSSVPLPTSGGWQVVSLPPFTLSSGHNEAIFEVHHWGVSSPVQLRVDDIVVLIPGYWESNNLMNLGFEEPRMRNDAPSSAASDGPDYWQTLFADGKLITNGLRPGATGRAVELTVEGDRCALRKDLTFLRPGQQIAVTGWVKATGADGGPFVLNAFIGITDRYWDLSVPNTQWQWLPSPGQWTQFSLTYTVPPPPTFVGSTTIAIVGGSDGDRILADDFTVTIQ